jgi:hypothetical protein
MKRNKAPRPLSLDELVDFFDMHDLGEHWDDIPEAHFEVDLKRRTRLVAIDADLATKLIAIARSKKTSAEGLVNSWLREKIRSA